MKLLSGVNPQSANREADGDAPVQAYIAAVPGWKSDVGCRLDVIIVQNVPHVRKADHVVEAFHDEDAVLRDELAVARFVVAGTLLTEQFHAPMKTFREAVFHGRFLAGAFDGGEASTLAFLRFVFHVAADPGQHLAVLGEDGVDQVAAQAPAALVAAAVVGEPLRVCVFNTRVPASFRLGTRPVPNHNLGLRAAGQLAVFVGNGDFATVE